MSLIAKTGHLVWSWKGPELLTSLRRRWPRRIRPSAGWYHDYPTILMALVAIGTGRPGSAPRRASPAPLLVSAVCGSAFHAASVAALARREPRYVHSALIPAEAAKAAVVSAAEEVVWESHGDRGPLALGLSTAGFGLVHRRLGGRIAVVHMAVFAVLARMCQAWGGIGASMCFHIGYNLAHLSERGPDDSRARGIPAETR